MTLIDIEKKIADILFRRGCVLTYTETEPSSEEDMYEITFFIETDKEKTLYRTMFIRNESNPRKKAFNILLDEIITSYYENQNIGVQTEVIRTN